MTSNIMNFSIGIDLGTTYSCVAVCIDGKPQVIVNENGDRTTSSCVLFENNEFIVGKTDQKNIYDVKRLIGLNYDDANVQSDIKYLPFRVSRGINNEPLINVDNKSYKPEEISAIILKKMKQIAEQYVGSPIKNAVITVPAYFNDSQRSFTKIAGELAGLNILRIINEPTAAAIAYGFNKKYDRNVLVFDLGGGTLDVSLLNIDNGIFTVIATSGDSHYGGNDFDNRLVVECIKEFHKKYPKINIKNMMTNSRVLSKLKVECENAKKILSLNNQVHICIDALYEGLDFSINITRAKFENICSDLFDKCLDPVKIVLKDSGMTKEEINDIVMVGGSTRIPKINDILYNFFKKYPKNDINPDEAVAIGASIQANILSNGLSDQSLVLLDVIPISLGLETNGGIMTKIIKKNSRIPCSKKKIFTTYSDNQPSISLNIYEGEREFVKDNNLLGCFEITNLPPMLRNLPKIKVKFSIDVNGILQVSAKEISDPNNIETNIVVNHSRFKNIDTNENQELLAKEYFNVRQELLNYVEKMKQIFDNFELKIKLGENKCRIINKYITDTIYLLNNENLSIDDCNNKKKEIECIIQKLLFFL